MTKTQAKVANATANVRPYVERALTDQELRDNVKSAFQAARDVYEELVGNRGVSGVASRVASDREIQEKLREAVEDLREASQRIQGKKDHGARNGMLLLVGIALGILFNPLTGPATRKWLADSMFGSDDFTYDTGPNGDSSSAA